MKNVDILQHKIKNSPNKPGVYQFFDKDNNIIYVGKAKNLKKRISSYFNKENTASGRLALLIRKISEIKYIVVDSEVDALLLENNLIKKHQPRYNVMLKDDKSYPWICLKNESFPRVFLCRNPEKDRSEYFGPYTSVRMIKTLLGLIKQLYPLRNCRHNLSKENIKKKKFKVCLEYHIGNCLGPCVGLQSANDYEKSINEIRQILKGNIASIVIPLKKQMDQCAKNYEFENAQVLKEKLFLLKEYQSKSTVVNPKINNIDVFSIISDDKSGYVNFLKVVNGAIIQAQTFEILKKLDESNEDLLIHAITELRQSLKSKALEVIVPFIFDFEIPGINFIVPKIGDKKKLLDLSLQNAKFSKIEKQKRLDFVDPDRHSKRILNQMMKDLRLQEPPEYIECFDNSNIQGDHPVAAMVVFRKAKPSKSEYRHYNIKTVSGANDFASMEEIVFRRYKRLLNENKTLPDLVIVDGGKGQLSSALSGLSKLNLKGKIPIIGIAKRLEEIYFPGDSVPLYIEKKSETLKIIQQLRDEAHRFGITHFRNKLEKHTIKSELTEIKGIGDSTTQKLLSKFKSVKKIKNSSLEELEKIIGKSKAQIVSEFFQAGKDKH